MNQLPYSVTMPLNHIEVVEMRFRVHNLFVADGLKVDAGDGCDHMILLARDCYVANLPSTKWLDELAASRKTAPFDRSQDFRWYFSDNKVEYDMRFKESDLALLFKLKWGGV